MSTRCWNKEDLDFDCDGRLIIKNSELADALRESIKRDGKVMIDLNPIACDKNLNCPCHISPPPPDGMCMCVAVGPQLSFPPHEGTS